MRDQTRDLHEFAALAARMRTHQLEALLHGDLMPLGQHTLRLLDEHPALQRRLQLLGDHLAAANGDRNHSPGRTCETIAYVIEGSDHGSS